MTAIYAIGDIHGQFDMMADALEWIEADGGPEARVIFLGDYVDRGPDSFRVLEMLCRGIDSGRDWIPLMGNHDRMFRRFLDHGDLHDPRILSGKSWLHPNLGGRDTLASYGVEVAGDDPAPGPLFSAAREAVPARHRKLLSDLALFHDEAGKVFVHAGVRPGVPLSEQSEDDLIWIREPFLSWDGPFDALIVHGHSPVEAPTHCGNRVNLDTGAGHDKLLSVGVFEGDEVFSLTEFGRAALGRGGA